MGVLDPDLLLWTESMLVVPERAHGNPMPTIPSAKLQKTKLNDEIR